MEIENEKWVNRIDRLKVKMNITTDSELARNLGITRAAINNVRKNKNKLSALNKLKILDRLGYTSIKDAIKKIGKN